MSRTSIRTWLLAAILAGVVSGGWLALTSSAVDGVSGPRVTELILVAVAIFIVLSWRVTTWVLRRQAGASIPVVLGRASLEGALVGAAIGAASYVYAVTVDQTPVIDVFVVLVLLVQMVLWLGVCVVLAALVMTSMRLIKGREGARNDE
ncbi:MAG: hypothetical protein RJB01_1012 [Actinomycetota bacterium]|jgi:uncharacterized protein HemY